MTSYIGIDPGLSGAIAIIDPHSAISILPIPVAGKEIDVSTIQKFLNFHLPDDPYFGRLETIACIEAVHSMPKQGVSSSFKFGFVTGILHGIIRTMNIPLETVTPQAWKKEILSGTDKSKQACIDWCLRTYPNISLFRTDRATTYDDGMADAVAIATFIKRKYERN